MAGKFVELKEAAQILGVTPEELVDMRSQGEIFGYRDGASWKFKMDEVDRVSNERSAAGKSGSGILSAGDDDDFGDFIGEGSSKSSPQANNQDSSDSVLVNDDLLAGSGVGRQSTVIGKDKKGKSSEDSDLKLTDEDSLSGGTPARASLSSKDLGKVAAKAPADDDSYDISDSVELDASSSDLTLKPAHGSDVLGDIELARPGSGTGVMGGNSASGTGKAQASGSDAYGFSDDSLSLADDDSIELDASDLKQGPGTGSDVTFAPGDSGINLRSPSDSGLSLDEEPLDLGGSGLDQLELPEDDDVIELEDEAADAEMATQLKADEAFSLSPVEGGADDDSDSGSQVIALEDSSAFDQNAATMLNQGPLLEEGAFTEAPMGGFDMSGLGGAAPGMMAGPMAGAAGQPYVVATPAETPYSVWNVLFLMGTAGVLALSGMLMWDVMMNLWSFDQGTPLSTSVMDSIISAVGLNKP